MNRTYQMSLMVGSIEDYQSGILPLGMLVQKIEGILNIVQDKTLKDELFDAILALEEVYARTRIGDFDFDNNGRPVVDRAVKQILQKVASYPIVVRSA